MKIDTTAPLARLADALPAILDARTGIVKEVREHPSEIDSPRFFRYNCSAANTEAFGEYRNFAVGGGAATTREMALAKAIGEAIERYCAAIYDKDAFPLSSFADAPFDCVPPSRFALYAPAQYAYPGFMFDPFRADSPVRWAPARDLTSGATVHVPAAMVYVPYFFYQGGEETPIVQPISTGLSCHCSLAESAIGALCEVVERDCFMITWQARLTRPRIRRDTLSAANLDLVERFEAVGYRVHLVDIANETGIPAVMAVARHDGGFVPLAVAAAVAPDAETAIRKALDVKLQEVVSVS
nr:YcaO-like family protein [uncultured Massilia sp.]